MEIVEKKKYFDFIQIFRGIAALMVVVHHSYGSFLYYHKIDIPFLKYIASIGKYGVDFFFVLSGFIITYTSFKYGGKISQIKDYLFNRFMRVYIPYWPVSVLMLILYLYFSSYSNGNRSISWITSIFLIPHGNPALSVAWTLVYEILFYFMFVFFFISVKLWNWLVVFWLLIIFYYNINPHNFDFILVSILVNNYNLHFILGFVLAIALRKGFRLEYYITLFSCFFFFTVFFYVTYLKINLIPFAYNFIFSLGVIFLIKLAVCHWDKKINKKNIFMIIGNATYSIYLIHNPLQAFLVRLLPSFVNNFVVVFLELIIVIVVCCIVGLLYYLVFEKMLIKKIKNKF